MFIGLANIPRLLGWGENPIHIMVEMCDEVTPATDMMFAITDMDRSTRLFGC